MNWKWFHENAVSIISQTMKQTEFMSKFKDELSFKSCNKSILISGLLFASNLTVFSTWAKIQFLWLHCQCDWQAEHIWMKQFYSCNPNSKDRCIFRDLFKPHPVITYKIKWSTQWTTENKKLCILTCVIFSNLTYLFGNHKISVG